MDNPTYKQLLDGVHAELLRIPKLATLANGGTRTRVIFGVPTSVASDPMIYTIVPDRPSTFQNAGATSYWNNFVTEHNLVVTWQDFTNAELEVIDLVPQIPDALRHNPRLWQGETADTALLPGGQCMITECFATWEKIANKDYRVVRFYSLIRQFIGELKEREYVEVLP